MGYTSQVVFAARGPKENIIAAITTWRLNLKHPEELKNVLGELNLNEDGNEYILTFQANCKWYASYLDVQMFEALFDSLRDDEEGIDTAFIRAGENDDDTETRYSGNDPYELASLRREVVLEVSVGKPLTEVLRAP